MESSLLLHLRKARRDIRFGLDLLRGALDRRLSPSHQCITAGQGATEPSQQGLQWLEEYIAQPHPQLGRDGAICPFVRSALLEDTVTFLTYGRIKHPTVAELRGILAREGVERIGRIVPDPDGVDLTAVLVMFPELGVEYGDMIWAAYNGCLEALNGRGVMLGAFFPGSKQPGLDNPAFHPFQAPFPICVMRPMALRDIQFIMNEDGFREYRRRYAAQYEVGAVAASTGLPPLYRRAVERFA